MYCRRKSDASTLIFSDTNLPTDAYLTASLAGHTSFARVEVGGGDGRRETFSLRPSPRPLPHLENLYGLQDYLAALRASPDRDQTRHVETISEPPGTSGHAARILEDQV